MVIRYLLECVSRDGAAAICVALKPDGSLDPGSVTQLQAVGNWMTINGAGIYGSHAWSQWGEGTNTLPYGKLSSSQANKAFTNADFRYTVGADGYLYAYCMTFPPAARSSRLRRSARETATWRGRSRRWNCSAATARSHGARPRPTSASPARPACRSRLRCVSRSGRPRSCARPRRRCFRAFHGKWRGASMAVPGVRHVHRQARHRPRRPLHSIASGLTTENLYRHDRAGRHHLLLRHHSDGGTTDSADSIVVPGILAGSSSWLGQDIGAVAANGEFAKSGNRIVISGSGADVWYAADEFYYACRKLNGDGSITARITSQQNTAPWAKAGLMIRESLNANSTYVIDYMSAVQWHGLATARLDGRLGGRNCRHHRLEASLLAEAHAQRQYFTAEQSANGTTWATLGTTSVTMASSVYVGLAACSVSDGTLMQAAFDQVSVTGQTSPEAPDSLAATAGDGKVDLSWPASSARRATPCSVPRPAAGLTRMSPRVDGHDLLDSSVTNGTTYYYVVTATNSVGTSGLSAEAARFPVDARQAWRSRILDRWRILATPRTRRILTTTVATTFWNMRWARIRSSPMARLAGVLGKNRRRLAPHAHVPSHCGPCTDLYRGGSRLAGSKPSGLRSGRARAHPIPRVPLRPRHRADQRHSKRFLRLKVAL